MSQVETIDLKGKDYALVPTRLKAFREANPRASVQTSPNIRDDGTVIFTTKIIQDRADNSSAEATGHSYGKLSGDKAFEKLETQSVGRALALLGYLNNGQIATTEEMADFEDYKQMRRLEALEQAKQSLEDTTSLSELKTAFMALSSDQKKELTELKDELKAKLEAKDADN